MGWKVIFAPQALEELEQIVRFIAETIQMQRFDLAITW